MRRTGKGSTQRLRRCVSRQAAAGGAAVGRELGETGRIDPFLRVGDLTALRDAYAARRASSRCHGVQILGPSGVTATVCSKWAASDLSCE